MERIWHKNLNTDLKSMATKIGRGGGNSKISAKSEIYIPNTFYKASATLLQCPTLCDPMDCSSPGSSVHGILQDKILEWVVMPSSRGSS